MVCKCWLLVGKLSNLGNESLIKRVWFFSCILFLARTMEACRLYVSCARKPDDDKSANQTLISVGLTKNSALLVVKFTISFRT